MINFVILCGGSGSRLWPKSREKLPKQFLPLTNQYSMLQNTILRINKVNILLNQSKCNLYIICNIDHYHIVDMQIKDLNMSLNTFIITEPKGRDSAPAICIASLLSISNNYTFIMPCDHIFDDEAFAQLCYKSIPYLEKSIVTFGIKPTHIETGYGYIKTNSKFETLCFIEKPNYINAKQYFEDPSYLWNAGIFAFKNENMIVCYENYAPDILDNCKKTLFNSNTNSNIIDLSPEPFINCRSVSIDYAIMEPLCQQMDMDNPIIKKITLPYNSKWNDIGSFAALFNELEKNDNNNFLKGNITTINTENCYIESIKPIAATIDIHNLVIIDTEDVLLVCDKDNTQKVKDIVNIYKKNNTPELLYHNTVLKPWGTFTILNNKNDNELIIKKYIIYPGKQLSFPAHNYKSIHLIISKGNAKITKDEKQLMINSNDYINIPSNMLYDIENIGSKILEFIETTNY